jgi:hypothetical protein
MSVTRLRERPRPYRDRAAGLVQTIDPRSGTSPSFAAAVSTNLALIQPDRLYVFSMAK